MEERSLGRDLEMGQDVQGTSQGMDEEYLQSPEETPAVLGDPGLHQRLFPHLPSLGL